MRAMILAAGFGTRLKPLTDSVPKPALPFAGVPLLAYPLFYLEKLGLSRLVVNTHYLPEQIEYVTKRLTHGQKYEVKFSSEQPTILDSGGGIGHARDWLAGEGIFCTFNGDEVMLFHNETYLKPVVEYHQKHQPLATILTCYWPGIGRQTKAVWTNKNGLVRGFGRETALHGPAQQEGGFKGGLRAEHFTGFIVFSERVFDYIPMGRPSNIFYECLLAAIEKGEKIHTFYDEKLVWLETGEIEEFRKSSEECARLLSLGGAEGRCLAAIRQRFSII